MAPSSATAADLLAHGRATCGGGAVAAAVAELAVDDVKRKEFGAAARAAVEGRTWAAVGDELIDHYRGVLRAASAEATLRTRPVSVQ